MEQTRGKAFDFVRRLAVNIRPELDLPAFPEVVRRLQTALANENTTTKEVVAIISSEPVLSARLMQMANSAGINPSGTPVASLNNAVNRMGFDLVRTISTAFALRQLSRNAAVAGIREDLEQVWKSSNEVAAICYAVARKAFGGQPDEALTAGLLHSIGRLYILMHTHQENPELRDDPDFMGTLEDWQPTIGKAILESWNLPAPICDAVESQDYLLGDGDADADKPLARLLSAAKLSHRLETDPELQVRHPHALDRLGQVHLGQSNFRDLVQAGAEDIREMRLALAV